MEIEIEIAVTFFIVRSNLGRSRVLYLAVLPPTDRKAGTHWIRQFGPQCGSTRDSVHGGQRSLIKGNHPENTTSCWAAMRVPRTAICMRCIGKVVQRRGGLPGNGAGMLYLVNLSRVSRLHRRMHTKGALGGCVRLHGGMGSLVPVIWL